MDKSVAQSEVYMDRLLQALPESPELHRVDSRNYAFAREVAKGEIRNMFSAEAAEGRRFGPFGTLRFPYRKMGAIDSLDLFGLDELIIFSFYWQNRDRYRNALDIGANIGLHSILMNRCGFRVRSFEPDPKTMENLKANWALNQCQSNEAIQTAVSDKRGQAEFVRVLGNTTGSHLAGAKANPYGDLEKFPVEIMAIQDLLKGIDFLKLDAEGHEAVILKATKSEDWTALDAIAEIGSPENANEVFQHFKTIGVHLYAQKSGWSRVEKVEDMPKSYKDGSLFISKKNTMPW